MTHVPQLTKRQIIVVCRPKHIMSYRGLTSAAIGLLYIALVPRSALAANTRLQEVFSWNTIQFQYSSPQENRSALESGRYIASNNLALGLERWQDKLFITVPRFRPGVYSTLNYVRLDMVNGSKSPALIPYPDLQTNTVLAGAGAGVTWPPRLVSVTRVRADACDRLWAVDTGVIDLATQPKQMTPPKIVVFDLKSNQLLFSYSLNEKTDYTEKSMFPTITVDVTSANCDHAFAYLPDVYSYSLVVYSLQTNSTHTVTHNYFHFDPLSGDFSNGGLQWQWQDGIFGLALSPVDREGYRVIYFHALASTMEFAVSSKYLQNTSLPIKQARPFKVLGNRGLKGQSSTSFLDEETGVLFYTLVNRNAVGCWNSFKGDEFDANSQGIVAEDEETLVFPNDIKVDKRGTLWVMNTPLPEFFFSTLIPKSVNFRVFSAPVRQAIKGTVCDEM